MWILDEIRENLQHRINSLEKMIQSNEVSNSYKTAKKDEISFLKAELQEIDNMMKEEVRDFELAEEDMRINISNAQIHA